MRRKEPNQYPAGWNAQRVREVAEHYDNQTEEEAAAEIAASRRRGDGLHRQNMRKEKIGENLTANVDEFSEAGTPKKTRNRLTTFALSPLWLERAKELAAAHHYADYRDWIAQIVKERLRLEHRLYQKLRSDAKRNHEKKRHSARVRAYKVS